jgi:hypothetical protein
MCIGSTELAMKGAKKINDLAQIRDKASDHPAVLDVLKQLGFYTDCYGDGHWSEPANVIDKELAQSILFTAKILVPKHETTAREIELWIECVAPYWGVPRMREAVVEFYRRLELEGIAEHTLEAMAEFLGLKPLSH